MCLLEKRKATGDSDFAYRSWFVHSSGFSPFFDVQERRFTMHRLKVEMAKLNPSRDAWEVGDVSTVNNQALTAEFAGG